MAKREHQNRHTSRKPVVVLNPTAGGGMALEKWNQIEHAVRARLGDFELLVARSRDELEAHLKLRREIGYDRFVAAGGDGTVNTVAEILMSPFDSDHPLRLGAIALGSSNDFYKPMDCETAVCGIPMLVDFEHCAPREVGLIRYEDEDGITHKRHWLLNASMGITADANAYFNHPDLPLATLKRHWTAAAIRYAALHTIATYAEHRCRMRIGGLSSRDVRVTNLGVVKNPHFAGSYCYDRGFEPSRRHFHVHLCEGMSTTATLYTLWHLSHGHFRGLPQTELLGDGSSRGRLGRTIRRRIRR